MKLHFLGVGSAFDENHTNISMVLEVNGKNILLDCGYDVPHEYFKHYDSDSLDAIWISHPHADHYYGLGMLIRMKSEERTKPLTILTRPEIKEYIEEVIQNSYPGSFEDCPFAIKYHLFEEETRWQEIDFTTAPSTHPVPNKAIRVDFRGKSFCYSGDGNYTEESKDLFLGCDLLVHETFTIDEDLENHGNIKSVVGMADEVNVENLAIAHLRRDVRMDLESVQEFLESVERKVLLPEENDTLEV